MKIVSINSVNYSSTGNIMLNICKRTRESGIDAFSFSAVWKDTVKKDIPFHRYFGSFFENGIHVVLSRLTGFHGCFSVFGTLSLIKQIKKIKPDIIHLHNLHFWCINLPIFFRFIKKNDIAVVWTLHDCWSFTGQCPYFTMINCEKWKDGCHNCAQYGQYPEAYVDRTETMWKLKRKWFTGIRRMTLVTPSEWLAGLVRQSFLRDFPVRTINNGIDLDVFKPTESDFRDSHAIDNNDFLLIGVASEWSERKGLSVFIELSKRLPDNYHIAIVGTSEAIERLLPDRVITIRRTDSQAALAAIYSAADLFVNPTREENYPTVNIESLACGTPVLTFRTGGSPEIIDESCGSVVECNDIGAMEKEIRSICENRRFNRIDCVNRAKRLGMNDRFDEYIKLYREIGR